MIAEKRLIWVSIKTRVEVIRLLTQWIAEAVLKKEGWQVVNIMLLFL
jgi:hypothetical protein